MPASEEPTDPSENPTTHDHQACPVAFCPVGMFLTFAGQARPEVVEHLVAAGRELMLAATALLDARAEAVRRRPPEMERIEVE